MNVDLCLLMYCAGETALSLLHSVAVFFLTNVRELTFSQRHMMREGEAEMMPEAAESLLEASQEKTRQRVTCIPVPISSSTSSKWQVSPPPLDSRKTRSKNIFSFHMSLLSSRAYGHLSYPSLRPF